MAYEKLIQLKPDWYRGWNHKAYVLIKLGRYQEADSALAQGFALNSNSTGHYYTRAYYYVAQGETELGIESLHWAIEMHTTHKSCL
ncbi:MAG: hypothetical protein F6K19_36215 [Cyanothece sp. SIO1E1]|nr:hypothetical protein [Cyanothece sp. SIO1E1]